MDDGNLVERLYMIIVHVRYQANTEYELRFVQVILGDKFHLGHRHA